MTEQNNSHTKSPAQSSVQSVVMRRVRTIHTLQPIFSSMTASGVLFILALWGVGREVWVAHVVHNEPSLMNVIGVVNFYIAAFIDTRFIVQVLTLVVLAAIIWFAYSSSKALQVTTGYRQQFPGQFA